jgi:magnesium transporter
MEERNEVIIKTVRALLEEEKVGVAVALLDSLHPADAAEVVEDLHRDDRIKIFQAWDVEESSEALEEMSEEDQVEVVQGLSPHLALSIVSEMSPDDAADLLSRLPEAGREDLLARMDLDLSASLRLLLAHGGETAGGLMTPNVVRFSQDLTVGEVLEELRRVPEDTEMVYYLYFQDSDERLTGVVSLREMIVADPGRPVVDVMHADLISVSPDADQEQVAQLIDRYDLLALPVVDRRKRLLGIVTVDDAMEIIEEEAKEDLYSLAGSWEKEEERERRPILASFKGRLPWLAVALCLELLLAGWILKVNVGFLRENISLVIFLPAVMFLGGTASVLSSTYIIHDVLGDDSRDVSFFRVLMREVVVGIVLGTLSGVVLALFTLLLQGDAGIAWAVGTSCLATVFLAACIGTSLPLVLERMGGDPARASEPLLATIMDIVSILVYLSLGFLLVNA